MGATYAQLEQMSWECPQCGETVQCMMTHCCRDRDVIKLLRKQVELYREALIMHGLYAYRREDGHIVTEHYVKPDSIWGESDPERARQCYLEGK